MRRPIAATVLLAAIATAGIAGPASADGSVAIGPDGVRIWVGDDRGRFGWHEGRYDHLSDDRYDRRHGDRYDRHDRRWEHRREARLEDRFVGRYIGVHPREIRRTFFRHGFEVLDFDRDGRVFEVAILRNGRVFDVEIDRRSGRIHDIDLD